MNRIIAIEFDMFGDGGNGRKCGSVVRGIRCVSLLLVVKVRLCVWVCTIQILKFCWCYV
jgi:hypothetical protein